MSFNHTDQSMTEIQKASSTSDCELIAQLANRIWHEHYTPIIGEEQVLYMINKYQSATAIQAQIQEGKSYFIIQYATSAVGYLSYYEREGSLFLSKLYVDSRYRGKGIGKKAMQFVEEQARTLGCARIALTVNKNNHNSIRTYHKMGFKTIKPIVIDIGNGFVMDDFHMEREMME